MRRKYFLSLSVFVLLILGFAHIGMAQSGGSTQFFSHRLNEFQNTISVVWRSKVAYYARLLFITTATLDLVLTGIGVTLGWFSAPPQKLFIRKIMFLALIFAIITFFTHLTGLADGFVEIGKNLSGYGNLSSASIMGKGLDHLKDVNLKSVLPAGMLDLITSPISTMTRGIVVLIFSIMAIVGFFIIALQFAFITVEATFIFSVGPLFLGFLPLKWTRQIGEKYFNYMIFMGVKLMVFYLIVSFVLTILDSLFPIGGNFTWNDVWSTGFISIISVFLLAKIPNNFAERMVGNVHLSLNDFLPSDNNLNL